MQILLAANLVFLLITVSEIRALVSYYSVKAISDINAKISNSTFNQTELRISLEQNYFTEALDLTKYANAQQNDVLISGVSGFLLNVSQLILQPNGSKLKRIGFQFSTIRFIDKLGRQINFSSLDDILASYFETQSFQNNSIPDLFARFESPFGKITMRELVFAATCTFLQPVNEILFKNLDLDIIVMHRLANFTLRRNLFEFDEIPDQTLQESLNSRVKEIHMLTIFDLHLNGKILNKWLFKEITKILITGTLLQIDESLLLSFKHLKEIRLYLSNLREFFHATNDNKWFESINPGLNFDFTQSNANQIASSKVDIIVPEDAYSYPNEDLCLFRHFPHNNLLFYLLADKSSAIIYFKLISPCILIHLTRYIEYNTYNGKSFSILVNKKTEYDCHFDERFSQCNLTHFQKDSAFDINYFDVIMAGEWLRFIGPIISIPFIAVASIVTNLISALVVLHPKNKMIYKLNRRIFTFMLFISLMSIIQCILSLFSLINECLGTNSLYCSPFMHLKTVQYMKIYIVEYLGEVMKTCSLLLLLCFTIERYELSTMNSFKASKRSDLENNADYEQDDEKATKAKKKNMLDIFLQRFVKIPIMVLVSICLALSILVSVGKLLEYLPDESYLNQSEMPRMNIYENMRSNYIPYISVYLFHYAFNDIIILALTVFFDVKLFHQLSLNLHVKKVFHVTELNNLNEKKLTKCEEEKLAMIDDICEAEKSLKRQTAFMITFYLLCRLPELASYLYLIFIFELDSMTLIGPVLASLSRYLYAGSYSFYLLIFINLNAEFKKAFKNLFKIRTL